ncbi:helix-turn-helix domain-containing protein [Spirosoma sp. RP8]|uniref:Helix-turn-helix domain-containing protein n=1 Tax=Spirosoma liriopis TaxID=2937440 RepID=A0ABT0HR10_9BACT|nr:helix-turn-helix transcriptional regulator [Spirosoma liriopis]MCK8494612.1 helix-turn-helix domain-containing protein [Spirosoma liriopis]
MSEIKQIVGQQIKQARLKAGLTQQELAEKLEISQTTVNKYETGRQNFTIETIQKIATALNANIIINIEP